MTLLIDSLHLACSRRAPRYALGKFVPDAFITGAHLVEETNDLASDVLPPRLLVVHDAGRGGQDDVAELTRGQELDDPLLHVAELDVVARADDAGLVEAGAELVLCSERM